MSRPLTVGLILPITAALVLGFVLRMPGCNGLPDWHWQYRDWTYAGRLPWSALPASIAAVALLLAVSPTARARLRHPAAALAALITLGVGWHAAAATLNAWGLIQIPYSVYDRIATSYYTEALRIDDWRAFLADYTQRMPDLALHAATHPPGAILFFHLMNSIFEHAPLLTRTLDALLAGSPLALDLVAQVAHLSRAQAAGLITASFLLPLAGVLAVVPLYLLARRWYGHEPALLTALAWTATPALTTQCPQMDQAFALLSMTAIALAAEPAGLRGMWRAGAAGLVVALGLFCSFAFLAIIFLIVVWYLLAAAAPQRGPGPLLAAAIFVAVPFVAFGALAAASGFNLLDAARTVFLQRAGVVDRPYWPWLIGNVYDFIVFGIGVTPTVLFVASLLRPRMPPHHEARRLAIVCAITLLALDISGATRGEVSRLWLFLMPAMVLCTAPIWADLLRCFGTPGVLAALTPHFALALIEKMRFLMVIYPEVLGAEFL